LRRARNPQDHVSSKTRAGTAPRGRPRGLTAVALLCAVAVALIAAGVTSSVTTPSPGGSVTAGGGVGSTGARSAGSTVRAAAATPLSGSVVLVDRSWSCTGAVDLDLVKVTLRSRSDNGIYLKPGCTGRIDRIEVDTWSLDGLKVWQGAHDIAIGGGYISCHARAGTTHQDGIQVQGGQRVTFNGLRVDCPESPNAALFINRGGAGPAPEDIVCNSCMLLPANSTVNIKDSIRSGVRNSTVCTGRTAAIRIQSGAVSPVNSGNTVLSRRDARCVSTA
jgi:hypothetical protein